MLSSIVCGSAEVTPEMAVRFGDEAAHATYERCGQAASEAFHHYWDAATKEFWQFIPIVIAVPSAHRVGTRQSCDCNCTLDQGRLRVKADAIK
jgi:hypothetical protein